MGTGLRARLVLLSSNSSISWCIGGKPHSHERVKDVPALKLTFEALDRTPTIGKLKCGMRCDAMRCDAMRCDAMRCDAMRCDAMRCDAMRCDAMRCDAMRCGAVPSWLLTAGRLKNGAQRARQHLCCCLKTRSWRCVCARPCVGTRTCSSRGGALSTQILAILKATNRALPMSCRLLNGMKVGFIPALQCVV